MSLLLRKLVREECAVTSTEYAVMLALLLGACTTGINCLGLRTSATFQQVSDSIAGAGPGAAAAGNAAAPAGS